jgi:hypothetical protein
LEDLSDASFLDKLLVLPTNVRPDLNVLARCKHSSLFGLIVSNEEKMFYNIDTRCVWPLFSGCFQVEASPFAAEVVQERGGHTLKMDKLRKKLFDC